MSIASLVLALFVMVEAPRGETIRGPILLDFHAEWCGPCRSMRPTIEELERRDYPVRSIDVDERPEIAERYQIEELPTYIVLDAQGKEVFREVGTQTGATLARWIERARDSVLDEEAAEPTEEVRPIAGEPIPVDAGAEAEAEASGRPGELNPRPWQTVVRISVHERSSMGYGSGTVIRSTPEETIILTCAHIFPVHGRRPVPPAEFDLPVTVEFFDGKLGGPGGQTVRPTGRPIRAEVLDYDHDLDVGLIKVRTGRTMPAARVVPESWHPEKNMSMYTVGCSHGQDATAWNTQITEASVRGLAGRRSYEAIQCLFSPKQGRSGGGLFTDDGYVAGVCNFAFSPRLSQGLYATPRSIYRILDRNGLQDLYAPPWSEPETAIASKGRNLNDEGFVRGQGPDDSSDRSTASSRLLAVDPITVPPPGLLGVADPGGEASEIGVATAVEKTRTDKGIRWRPVSAAAHEPDHERFDDLELPGPAGLEAADDDLNNPVVERPLRRADAKRNWKPIATRP